MEVFPYVRVYGSVFVEGFHYLASMSPIPERSARVLVDHMPDGAVIDMMEWGPADTPVQQFSLMLSNPASPAEMIARSPHTPALQDDRPVNEYYLLRRFFPEKHRGTH
jgi:hypothetical protein